jgi:hypothetical protein
MPSRDPNRASPEQRVMPAAISNTRRRRLDIVKQPARSQGEWERQRPGAGTTLIGIRRPAGVTFVRCRAAPMCAVGRPCSRPATSRGSITTRRSSLYPSANDVENGIFLELSFCKKQLRHYGFTHFGSRKSKFPLMGRAICPTTFRQRCGVTGERHSVEQGRRLIRCRT